MSMQDPISDMIIRICNAQKVNKKQVTMPFSKQKLNIAQVLKEEGYIDGCDVHEVDGKRNLDVTLKYHHGKAVIERMKRISKPSKRHYVNSKSMPVVAGGLGVAIVSTSRHGVTTAQQAQKDCVGGEVLMEVI